MPRRFNLGTAVLALLVAVPAWATGILMPKDEAIPPPATKDQKITVTVTDNVARATVEHVFLNRTDTPLAATRVSPIPAGARLDDFAMMLNGKRVKGAVRKRGKALRSYADMVRRMRDPGLIGRLTDTLFPANIFPVPANGQDVAPNLDGGRAWRWTGRQVPDAGGTVLPSCSPVAAAQTVAIGVAADGATYPVGSDPAFADDNWASMGTVVGGSVAAVAVERASGILYVGGSVFPAADGAPIVGLAQWDGSTWSALGTGLDGVARALVLDANGNLFVGGDFHTAGGVAVNHVAKWNGSAWAALGAGVNASVNALALDGGGNLYVGGGFTAAGGTAASRIAKWDGSDWSALGTGVNNSVLALVCAGSGNLYAGGQFTTAGGAAANRIARWDGSNWSALGTGANSYVAALAFAGPGRLYAGGYFTAAGGNPADHVAQWDGSAWAALGASGSGPNDSVFALALDGSGNVYAAGEFTAVGGTAASLGKWNGSTWSAVAPRVTTGFHQGNPRAHVWALAFDAGGSLYVGGEFTAAGAVGANHLARWDGSAWTTLTVGGSGLNDHVYALAADGSGNVYAAGEFIAAGSATVNRVAKWNAGAWTPLGAGMTGLNYPVLALALDCDNHLYAAGAFTVAGGVAANRIAKWNGSNWAALGSGLESTAYALVADDQGNVYVGGIFATAGGVAANGIAKWDGSNWSALGVGVNGAVLALACDGSGNLYAAGQFTQAGGVAANRVAKWDGSEWSALGDGVDNSVEALACDGSGNLYAGGYFTTAGGVAASRVAQWNGSAWAALGSGMVTWPVWALACDSAGTLYAGGEFTIAGGVTVNRVAQWNGSAWAALGSGVDDEVLALAYDGSANLYVGGKFTTAGGRFAAYAARAILTPGIVISTDYLTVLEGQTATFRVKLAAAPAADVTVTVARTAGDSDLAVAAGASLTFTAANWASDQPVTLAAAADADADNGSATIGCSASGFAERIVVATEADDDTTLTVTASVGGTTAPSGATLVTRGAATPIAATPEAAYVFGNWTVTAGAATIADPNAVTTTAAIAAPATLHANFTRPPTIASPAWAAPNPVTLPAGTTVHVVASDPDGDPLTYAWTKVSGAGTATFAAENAADSGVTFGAAGTYVLRVTVADGRGGSVASDVTVTVNSGVDARADVNHDGVVNALDLQIVVANFGKTVGSPGCDARADANADGVVNALDLQIVIANFGKVVP